MNRTELYIYSYMKDDKSGFAILIKHPDLSEIDILEYYNTNSKTFFRLNCISLLRGLQTLMTEIVNNKLPKSRQVKIYSNFDANKLMESKSKGEIFTKLKLLFSKFDVENINIKDILYDDNIKRVRKQAWYTSTHPSKTTFMDSQYDKPNRPIK